jgi:ATP-dependent Clp protease, protease subunit
MLPKSKYWQIKNQTELSADIYLYDEIGDWWGETSAKDFKESLDEIGDVQVLNIYINSPGGSVFEGMAIYNQLKRHKAQKNVYVDGIAASIASVIALAGDKITIPKNAFFMIHQPWAITWGPASEFRRMADALDTIEDGMLNVYEGHSSLSREEIKQLMDAETWMTGEEALERGFADELGEEVQIAASAVKSEIWGKFKNAPEIEAPEAPPQPTNTEENPGITPRVFDYQKRVKVREIQNRRKKA